MIDSSEPSRGQLPPQAGDAPPERELEWRRDESNIDLLIANSVSEHFDPLPHGEGLDIHVVNLGRPALATLEFLQPISKKHTNMDILWTAVEPRVQKRGIGSLMLAQSVQFNLVHINPCIETVRMRYDHPALIAVMRKVFGAENVHGLQADIDQDRIMAIDIGAKLRELGENGRVDITS